MYFFKVSLRNYCFVVVSKKWKLIHQSRNEYVIFGIVDNELSGGWGSAYKNKNLELLSWGLDRLRWVTVPMQCLGFWPMLRADWALYCSTTRLFLVALTQLFKNNLDSNCPFAKPFKTHFCSAQGSCIEARSLENRGQPLAWKTNPILVSRLIPRFEYFCYEMIWIPNTSGQLNHGNFVGSEAPRPPDVICTVPRN